VYDRTYRVNVLDSNGAPLPLPAIHSQMLSIATAAATPASNNPGVLTTMARDDWTAARTRLLADPTNASSLKAVDEALFVVCLDDAQVP